MDDLQAELDRGRRLDRVLADAIGRPEPTRAASAPSVLVESLNRPATCGTDAADQLVRAAQDGEPSARARLVEACMPLVAGVARTYRTGSVERLELLQEGVVGLLRALERYDPGRGVPFWGYASWWVRQAMQQLVSELTRPVVLSDRALRHLARLKDAHQAAITEHGHEPGPAELSRRTGLAAEQISDLLATERPARSLDEPLAGTDGTIDTFGDLLADPLAQRAYEDLLDAVEIGALHDLLAGLSDRERHILRVRHGFEETDTEPSLQAVGERLGLSGERVRQIEQRALGKLASALTTRPQ